MKILLISVLAVAMIGLMVPSAYALEDKGDFYLIFNSPVDDSDIIKMAVNELNRSYVLQQDIPIKFQKCGYENAYWDNSIKTVVMCEELVSMFQEQFGKSFKDDLEMQQTFTLLATLFVMYHEVGHGLVDEYSLPVLAREENYVDRFAAFEMIEMFGDASLSPTILWYLGSSSYGTVEILGIDIIWDESAYAGKHNLNEQRGYDMACLGFGALLTSGEKTTILKEYAVLLEGKRTELSCKSEYGYNAYSFQTTFNQFHPETVAKKNAYEKEKRDAILKAQSEEEQLQLNAYNMLLFLYEDRIPWVKEKVRVLAEYVVDIDTVGAPSGTYSITGTDGELYIPDEKTRIKIDMQKRINEWLSDVTESVKVSADAYENNEFNTAIQYAEKSMKHSESGPELFSWLNVQIAKINEINQEEIRQEEIRQEEIRQEEIRQETESRNDYLIDDAYHYEDLLQEKFDEARALYDDLQYLFLEADKLDAFDQVEDIYDSQLELLDTSSGLWTWENLPSYHPNGWFSAQDVIWYIENEMYSEAQVMVRDAEYDSNEMDVIIKKLKSYNEQTQEIIDNYKIEIEQRKIDELENNEKYKELVDEIQWEEVTIYPKEVMMDVKNRQDLMKKWNNIIFKLLPSFNLDERLEIIQGKHQKISDTGYFLPGNNNLVVYLQDGDNNPPLTHGIVLKQEITDVSTSIDIVEAEKLIVKEKLNHMMSPYNPDTLEHMIYLEDSIFRVDYDMRSLENEIEEIEKSSEYNEYLNESANTETQEQSISSTDYESSSEGGGCLIATATFGSEMAPQVQFLREIRDGTVMSTESGTAFMTGFNQFYYSFSPQIADYERENPVFKEAVKVTLTPLLTSLTLLNYVEIDSEEEMLGYGIGIILLNVGMYFVAPAVLIISLKKKLQK